MTWDIDGLAQVACIAAGKQWNDLSIEEKAVFRAIAIALLDAITRAALA